MPGRAAQEGFPPLNTRGSEQTTNLLRSPGPLNCLISEHGYFALMQTQACSPASPALHSFSISLQTAAALLSEAEELRSAAELGTQESRLLASVAWGDGSQGAVSLFARLPAFAACGDAMGERCWGR